MPLLEQSQDTMSDNIQLLEHMMSDTAKAPAEFSIDGPTAEFLDTFYTQLKEQDLKTMVQGRSYLLNTIGACNFSPLQQMEYNLGKFLAAGEIDPTEHQTLLAAARIISDKSHASLLPYEISLEHLNLAAYRMAELFGQTVGAKPLAELSMSDAAYPEYSFEVDGRSYSYLFLYYYCRYAFCAQFVDFDTLDYVMEVGSGSGRAVEVIKKLHPHLTFLMFELGPQLYVSQRFLSTIFPDSVVDYEKTRHAGTPLSLTQGGIHFFPHYRIQEISLTGKTLSWNTMVFGIMSPDRVQRYFSYITQLATYVYLVEPSTAVGGQPYGMDDVMTFERYDAMLKSSHYELLRRERAFRPLAPITGWGGVDDMIWQKKP